MSASWATSLIPLTASSGTTGNAAAAMFAVRGMVSTPVLAAHFTPQGLVAHTPLPLPREGGGGGTEGITSPSASCVHSVNSLVPVGPDQHRGLCDSVAVSSLDSTGLTGSSVPVLSFSLLAPVNLVSPLQLSQFQAELRDYPDQTAAAFVLTSL